jgi:hypothetical protein
MKFLVSVFLIALLSFAASLYLPWWSVAIAAFLVIALIHQSPLPAFFAGFLSVFLLWSILAFIISYRNDDILAGKVSQLIIRMDNPLLLVLITGLIGGITAGLAALSASFIRKPQEEQQPPITE